MVVKVAVAEIPQRSGEACPFVEPRNKLESTGNDGRVREMIIAVGNGQFSIDRTRIGVGRFGSAAAYFRVLALLRTRCRPMWRSGMLEDITFLYHHSCLLKQAIQGA